MNPLDVTLALLHAELEDAAARPERDVVLFGSAVLKMHGLIERTPGDVDAFVTPELWQTLRRRPRWAELEPREGDPRLLEWRPGPVAVAAPPVWIVPGWEPASLAELHAEVDALEVQPLPVHLFVQWSACDPHVDVAAAWREAEQIGRGWRTWQAVPLWLIAVHKRGALTMGNVKHADDLALLERAAA